MSRHKDGEKFRPSTISRELWPGRTVVYAGWQYIVLALEGESAWIWRKSDPADTILRIGATSDVRLFSGEKRKITQDRRGYSRVYLGLEHPLSNTGGWQYAHRLALVPFLGRLPTRREVIEHRDRQRDGEDGPFNSAPSNLVKDQRPDFCRRRAGMQQRISPGRPDGGRFVTGLRQQPPPMVQQKGLWS